MKNLFFAIALIFAGTYAQANVNSITLSEISILNQIELTLDLGDLTNSTDAEINEKIENFIKNNLNSEEEALDCSVTVTGSISVGIADFEISVTVSGTCEEIAASGSQIANQVLTNVKKYIKENF